MEDGVLEGANGWHQKSLKPECKSKVYKSKMEKKQATR